MTEQFKEQGGAATMDPSGFGRWLTSMVVRKLISEQRLNKKRRRTERRRQQTKQPHVVEYFHQIDDGYSHLAVQMLSQLLSRYDIQIKCHLVSASTDANAPEPKLLANLSRYDASKIAPHYGLHFPQSLTSPNDDLVILAQAILANFTDQQFVNHAADVSTAFWQLDRIGLEQLSKQYGLSNREQITAKIEQGNQRRAALKHYSGGMFYYAGEWYWGVDRLYHLEHRLSELGADRQPDEAWLAPQQQLECGPLTDNGSLTLEMFASLRSPYTAIVFDRTIAFAKAVGITLKVRPILPMVMRGVPATREKGFYIFSDCAREARLSNSPFGRFYDPIGEPARRCYSLYPWACSEGKGNELLSSFLRAAFAEGINTNSDSGLRHVVKNAGLDWSSAKSFVGTDNWQSLLESNRLEMYDNGLWGAPSFRLLNTQGESVISLWGQDRLWLISREIQRLLSQLS